MCECLKQSIISGLIIMQKEKVVNGRKNIRPTKILVYIAQANGRKVGTIELKQFLDSQGFDVGIRTIQRDLNLLQEHFCNIKGDNCSPQGWYFSKNKDSQLVANLLKEAA